MSVGAQGTKGKPELTVLCKTRLAVGGSVSPVHRAESHPGFDLHHMGPVSLRRHMGQAHMTKVWGILKRNFDAGRGSAAR